MDQGTSQCSYAVPEGVISHHRTLRCNLHMTSSEDALGLLQASGVPQHRLALLMAPLLKHSGAISHVTARTLLSSHGKTQELCPKAFLKRQSQAKARKKTTRLPAQPGSRCHRQPQDINLFRKLSSSISKLVGWFPPSNFGG